MTWFYAALVAIAVVDLELLAVALLVRRGVKQMMRGGMPGLPASSSLSLGLQFPGNSGAASSDRATL